MNFTIVNVLLLYVKKLNFPEVMYKKFKNKKLKKIVTSMIVYKHILSSLYITAKYFKYTLPLNMILYHLFSPLPLIN